MARRDSYLLAWGVAYSMLGLFVITSVSTNVWGLLFGVAGVFAIVGAVSGKEWLDTLGFMALTGSAAIRGVASLFYIFKDDNLTEVFSLVLWLAVGVAQFIVSGWKEPTIAIENAMLPEDSQGELSESD